jgi:hypothetical protein
MQGTLPPASHGNQERHSGGGRCEKVLSALTISRARGWHSQNDYIGGIQTDFLKTTELTPGNNTGVFIMPEIPSNA